MALSGGKRLAGPSAGVAGGAQGSPPVRVPNGVHRDRLSLILAVLSKHTTVKPFSFNVHTNVVHGMTMREPSTDLAIALAIAASYFSAIVPPQMAVIGELGLGGELRCHH